MVTLRKEVELGTGGRVVIPAEMREALDLHPGDRLVLTLKDGRLELTTPKAILRKLHGSLAKDDGRDLTAELLAERREAAEGKGW
ncbi:MULTISPECIES: AbrB/MazE/SpoVT family DNA-binding domain-containing protein [unclassified Meiothermus]|uniref:AbrB/MazE/SpoVT family DNA-binding domain-containing protein n=1 Tax=unclassified Meiothermus TaxID=370471 RepID=UPI000D7C91CE|nr:MULTISPECIES: AbrB/MazE/SpoVT family DNA-binding domain-containing protein [unclassified Meiothermus]PZA07650.1 AbrB/MazE/SpoVT family DNA-binding domain-containing protein [Meiothermus sp. Pnk-1]RYM36487.1 AbrB/MazE/SpoVT family DNA-binding domain-containing protein [Meiothermus sp. PNK-Is4]